MVYQSGSPTRKSKVPVYINLKDLAFCETDAEKLQACRKGDVWSHQTWPKKDQYELKVIIAGLAFQPFAKSGMNIEKNKALDSTQDGDLKSKRSKGNFPEVCDQEFIR